jgi:hypothetical protein
MFMTQAQGHRPATSPAPTLGAAAAAAATNGGAPATADVVTAKLDGTQPAKPPKPPKKKASDMTEAEKAAAKEERLAKSKKIFIVVGEVHEFATPAKAEKYLNTAGAPENYAVIRGLRVGANKKVTLR